MSIDNTTAPGIRPGLALLVMVLLSGCGGVGSGPDEATAGAQPAHEAASMQSAAVLHPVERPVAKPMDRGAGRPASIQPVERPVAKPLDRPAHDEAQPDRS